MSKLEVTIELTGLQSVAEESLKEVLSGSIKDIVTKIVQNSIKENYKDIIEERVSIMLAGQIDIMLYNHKVQIGGDYFSDEPAREVTIAELTDEKVKEYITNNQFTTKDRYGEYTRIKTFQEYVDEKLCLNTKVQKELNSFVEDIRYDISEKMKEMFNESTRTLLSDSILNLLQQNETYRRIETNISTIAGKDNGE